MVDEKNILIPGSFPIVIASIVKILLKKPRPLSTQNTIKSDLNRLNRVHVFYTILFTFINFHSFINYVVSFVNF